MSHPIVPEPEYKMPEDGMSLSESVLIAMEEESLVDEYDERVDQFNPFYN